MADAGNMKKSRSDVEIYLRKATSVHEQGRRLTNAFLSELRTLGIADNRPVLKKEMYFLFSERVAGNARPTKNALPLVRELTNGKAWGPL